MSTIDDQIKALKAQLQAAEEEKTRADKAESARIKKAKRLAGDNHVRVVLRLYDLLGIEPQGEEIRIVSGERRIFQHDKDESARTEALYEAVVALVEASTAVRVDDDAEDDASVDDEAQSDDAEDDQPDDDGTDETSALHGYLQSA